VQGYIDMSIECRSVSVVASLKFKSDVVTVFKLVRVDLATHCHDGALLIRERRLQDGGV
jgi:hypothetical protein